jgi:hypothetical protein
VKIHLALLGLALSACAQPPLQQQAVCAIQQADAFARAQGTYYSKDFGTSLDPMIGERVLAMRMVTTSPTSEVARTRFEQQTREACGVMVVMSQ